MLTKTIPLPTDGSIYLAYADSLLVYKEIGLGGNSKEYAVEFFLQLVNKLRDEDQARTTQGSTKRDRRPVADAFLGSYPSKVTCPLCGNRSSKQELPILCLPFLDSPVLVSLTSLVEGFFDPELVASNLAESVVLQDEVRMWSVS